MKENDSVRYRVIELNASLKNVEQKILHFANFYLPEAQEISLKTGARLQGVEFIYEYSTGEKTVATFVEDLEVIYKTRRVGTISGVENSCDRGKLKEILSFLDEEKCYLFWKLLCNPSEPMNKWLRSISEISMIWAEVKVQFEYVRKITNWKTAKQVFDSFCNMLLESRYGEKIFREWARRLVLNANNLKPCQYLLTLYGGLYNSSLSSSNDFLNRFIEFFEDRTFNFRYSREFLYSNRIFQFLEEQEVLGTNQEFDIRLSYELRFPYKIKLDLNNRSCAL